MARRILIAVFALLAVASPALAVDGVDNILIPTGQRLDTYKVNVGGTDVQRQRFIPCGTGATACAEVVNSSLQVNPRDASGNAYSSTLSGSVRTFPVTLYDGSGNLQATFGGSNILDSGAYSRGTTAHTTAGCVVETTAGSYSTGASRGIRCNDKAEPYVVVPDRGTTLFPLLSLNSTNSNLIRNGATVLYGFDCTNSNASPRYVKIYNLGSAPTVGTSGVFTRFAIPGTSGGVAGHRIGWPPDGVAMDTGFGVGLTTGIADNDTGAVGANEVACSFFYRAAS